MIKFTPSQPQLIETLEHIQYEIIQLIGTLQGKTHNPTVNNALIESRLIHVRALLDFFERKKRSKRNNQELDDVLSADYGFSSRKIDIPQQYRERLNKDLAHLTYSRSQRQPADKVWHHDQVIAPILERCTEFCEHLIENFLPKKSSDQIKDWQYLVEQIKQKKLPDTQLKQTGGLLG